MAKSPRTPETEPDTDAPAGEQTPTPPGPPQGITVRHMETGNPAIDYHRIHNGRNGLDPVKRIDPRSLKTNEVTDPQGNPAGDPWLMLSGKTCMQVRADHAAELLEVDEPTGGASRHRLATDDEIAAEKRRMQASLRP